MTFPDSIILLLLVCAKKPYWHQTGLSQDPASQIVELESRLSMAYRQVKKSKNSPLAPFVWTPSLYSVLCICRFGHWVPIPLCRPISLIWHSCHWMVSLGSKFRCIEAPCFCPSLPGATGPNRHLSWLCRLFWVPHNHSQSQPDRSWHFQKLRNVSFSSCSLAPAPFQNSQLSPTVRSPLCPLPSSYSESMRIPLVAVDTSSGAASSTSEESRLSDVSWVFIFSASCRSYFIAVPCFTLLSSFWISSLRCQIRSCYDPSSSRLRVSVLSRIEPTSDSLMITSRSATTLRVLGTYSR